MKDFLRKDIVKTNIPTLRKKDEKKRGTEMKENSTTIGGMGGMTRRIGHHIKMEKENENHYLRRGIPRVIANEKEMSVEIVINKLPRRHGFGKVEGRGPNIVQ